MYNTIKLGYRTQGETKSIKASIKKGVVVASNQVILLSFSRHLIVKKDNGFMLVIEYLCPNSEYLYEFIMNPVTRYYAILKTQIIELTWKQINFQEMKLNNTDLCLYKGGRKVIS